MTAEGSTKTMTRPQYPDYILDRFTRDTANHQMAVLHDDGLYRHLRFRSPDNGFYWFDLVTWPGYLSLTGDTDGYTFTRDRDMFEFFRSPKTYINPGYWAEKIVDGRERASAYSREKFVQLVTEHAAEAIRYQDVGRGFARAVREQILDGDYDLDYEDTAREALNDFHFSPPQKAGPASPFGGQITTRGKAFRFEDTWEWNFRDWDWTYLWACHAIQWGIRQYDAARATAPEPVGAAA